MSIAPFLSRAAFRPAQSRMIAAIHAARRLREKARESRRESEGDACGGFRGKAIRRGAIAVQAAVRLANAADPQEDESLKDGPTAAQSSPGSIAAGRRLPGSDYFLHVKLQWDGNVQLRPESVRFCLPKQREAFQLYQSRWFQYLVASAIAANFMVNIAEKVSRGVHFRDKLRLFRLQPVEYRNGIRTPRSFDRGCGSALSRSLSPSSAASCC